MDIVKLNSEGEPRLSEIDGIIRIEEGPVRKTAIATIQFFAEHKLRDHYHLPKQVPVDPAEPDGETKTVIALDASVPPVGIIAGEPFTYIDWDDPARAFYVYRKEEESGRWAKVDEGTSDTYEAALSFASGLI